ncbi:unnamed protein product [Moneuplotes crassus]|uniref:Uncharacterized protein n=1 Tax=Euplotes crassus TaxID=5936 RepID=A0AAD1TZE7_EUPCR|nr:unnamed protein product [Moneuplotes crassus]
MICKWFGEAHNTGSFISVTDEIEELCKTKEKHKDTVKAMQWILNNIICKPSKKKTSEDILVSFINLVNSLKNKYHNAEPIQKLIYELIIFCCALLRDSKVTVQTKSLNVINQVMCQVKDLELLDDKARKCIWSNALFFTKENKPVELKITCLEISGRIHKFLMNRDKNFTEINEITKHLNYLVLKDEEERVRVQAFKALPVCETTYKTVFTRITDIAKKIRQIAYQKISKTDITLKQMPETLKIRCFRFIQEEVSKEIQPDAEQCLQKLIFPKKGDKKLCEISIETNLVMLKLVRKGFETYFDIPHILETEGTTAVNFIKDKAKLSQNNSNHIPKELEFYKSCFVCIYILSYLKEQRDLVGLYTPFARKLPSAYEFELLFIHFQDQKYILSMLCQLISHIQLPDVEKDKSQWEETVKNHGMKQIVKFCKSNPEKSKLISEEGDKVDFIRLYNEEHLLNTIIDEVIYECKPDHKEGRQYRNKKYSEIMRNAEFQITNFDQDSENLTKFERVCDLVYFNLTPNSKDDFFVQVMTNFKSFYYEWMSIQEIEKDAEKSCFNFIFQKIQTACQRLNIIQNGNDSEETIGQQVLSKRDAYNRQNGRMILKTRSVKQNSKRNVKKKAYSKNMKRKLREEKEEIKNQIKQIKKDHENLKTEVAELYRKDMIWTSHYLKIIKMIIELEGKDHVQMLKNKGQDFITFVDEHIKPFMEHPFSKEISLVAIECAGAACLASQEVALEYMKYFKEKIEKFVPRKNDDKIPDFNSVEFDFDEKAVQERVKTIIPGEASRYLKIITDSIITHSLLSKSTLQTSSQDTKFLINDTKTLLLKNLTNTSKPVQNTTFVCHTALLMTNSFPNPSSLLTRILLLREELKPHLERQSKGLRKIIDLFLTTYSKISISNLTTLYKSFLGSLTFITLAKAKGYPSPWLHSKERTLAQLVLPLLSLKTNVAFSLEGKAEVDFNKEVLGYLCWIQRFLKCPGLVKKVASVLVFEATGALGPGELGALGCLKGYVEGVMGMEKVKGLEKVKVKGKEDSEEFVRKLVGEIEYETIWEDAKGIFGKIMTKEGEYDDRKVEKEGKKRKKDSDSDHEVMREVRGKLKRFRK